MLVDDGGFLVGKADASGTATWNIGGNVTIGNTSGGGELDGSIGGGGNSVFNLAGNLINNQNIDITGNANFNLNFIGTSSQSVTGNGSGDFYTQNITINNSAGAVLSTPIYLYGPLANGTLTLTSGLFSTSANLTLASKSVISRSGGSISGSPTFSAATDVTYTGSSPITTGPELPSSAGLGNLTINCSGGVTLGGAAPVNGNLILTSGTLSLGSNNLTIASTKTITGASSSNYIVTNGTGYLIQQVPATSTNVTFPVGTSSAYNPVILNNGGTTDNYSVRVASGTANVVSAAGVVAINGQLMKLLVAEPKASL